ncbi:MAG: hypothetical protein KF764_08630 [Labilithrix sp.]|nr:hypothetical protein [Labilithrix sp.]
MARRTWLDNLFGPWTLRALGVEHPERPVLEIAAGPGVALAVVDVPATDATKLTISAPGGGAGGGVTITNAGAGPLHNVATADDGTPASVVRFTSSPSAVVVSGLQGGTAGREITLVAVNAPLIFWNENGSSSATNRIITHTGGNFFVAKGAAAKLVFDGTTNRWRVAGVGAFAISDQEGTLIGAVQNGVPIGTPFAFDEDTKEVSLALRGGGFFTKESPIHVETDSASPLDVILVGIPPSTAGIIHFTATLQSDASAKRFGSWQGSCHFYRKASGNVLWTVDPDEDAIVGRARNGSDEPTAEAISWKIISGAYVGVTLSPTAAFLMTWDISARVQWTRPEPGS